MLNHWRSQLWDTGARASSTSNNSLLFRPRRSRSAAVYSRQNFPVYDLSVCWSVRRSVGRSVCPVHCGKTADRIRMPFGIIGRTGPGMRQVVGFGDRSAGRSTFGANLEHAIVTNGDFTAHVCDSAATRPSSQITLVRLVIIIMKCPAPRSKYRRGQAVIW